MFAILKRKEALGQDRIPGDLSCKQDNMHAFPACLLVSSSLRPSSISSYCMKIVKCLFVSYKGSMTGGCEENPRCEVPVDNRLSHFLGLKTNGLTSIVIDNAQNLHRCWRLHQSSTTFFHLRPTRVILEHARALFKQEFLRKCGSLKHLIIFFYRINVFVDLIKKGLYPAVFL